MSAPRIPNSIDYWINKGKYGKDVMIYTHDDLDGIYSAIIIRRYMEERGFNIKGYGVMNYQEAWRYTMLNPKMINIVVDYANMPPTDRADMIDVYIDHHGVFSESEIEDYKLSPVIKTDTDSAYEGMCYQLGVPCDELILNAIDMVDSAKYTIYGVDWRDILTFDWGRFITISKEKGIEIGKLTFAGAFNQLIKRSDHKTIVEVIENIKDPSIYAIYFAMTKLYPGNNIWTRGEKKGEEKDFVEDGRSRIKQMTSRTIGKDITSKQIFMKQKDFYGHNKKDDGLLGPKGYQLIGNLVFVPTGTWANALRARAIILKEYDAGVIPESHKLNFIMLQYGNTIQVCGFDQINEAEEFPTLKDGTIINNLGTYMGKVLEDFKRSYGYYEADTSLGQDELTVSGGHAGIGTISNIIGEIKAESIKKRKAWKEQDLELSAMINLEKHDGQRYLNLFKNRIIKDLSGASWNKLDMVWSVKQQRDIKYPEMDHKVVMIDDIRKIDVMGIVQPSINEVRSWDAHLEPEEDEVL